MKRRIEKTQRKEEKGGRKKKQNARQENPLCEKKTLDDFEKQEKRLIIITITHSFHSFRQK